MPLTTEQIAKIRQKEQETPDALKRNPLNDYTEGWFHVTLNVRSEAPILGVVMGSAEAPDGSANAPRCALTELGKRVEKEWRGIGRYYEKCVCEEIQIMPNHIHALLHLLPGNKGHLGRIVNGLMIGCTHAYWDTLGIDWREMRQELEETLKRKMGEDRDAARTLAQSRLLRSKWQDRDHTRSFRGPALFVRGYNDVEAVTAEEIDIKRQYIHDNPRKYIIQGENHECFRKYRNCCSRNWTVGRIIAAIYRDASFRFDLQRCEAAITGVVARLGTSATALQASPPALPRREGAAMRRNLETSPTACTYSETLEVSDFPRREGAAMRQNLEAALRQGDGSSIVTLPSGRQIWAPDIRLDYIGARALMFSEKKLPLVCHRADAMRFEEQKAAVFDAARQGYVIVSAFISQKERDIKLQLMIEQLPFIEIIDNAIPDKYKGVGKAFYAIAEQRLCQVSPWAYRYDKDVKVTREMCLVMNELARIISGREDDWWKSGK